MGETLTERFREAFFEKILTFEIEWFDQENNSSGALCARLATDAVMMRTLVTDRLSLLTQAVSSATLAVVLAFMLSWRLALVAIALEPGVIAAIYLREMSMRIMSKKTLKAQSASSALASEAVGNHKIITAFGSQEKVVKLYDRSQVSSGKESNSQSWYAGTINGGIEFKQVYFIYPARPKQIILRGVDLKIEASKIVALVGRSGSGKATTIRLIERFYDTLSGSIEVDGINIMCSNLRASRSHIALVSQEQTLFAGTRRDNIAYAKEKATEVEIVAAIVAGNRSFKALILPLQPSTAVETTTNRILGLRSTRTDHRLARNLAATNSSRA
nr:ABC transporter B family member 22-like [Populus alba]